MAQKKQQQGLATVIVAAAATLGQVAHAAPPADQDAHTLAWHQQLANARLAYYADLEGKREADGEARERFAALMREHPHDSTLEAYSGSLELLEAARTWAVWRKHTLSMDGLQEMDAAVEANPADLEARFVRALTTWHLPFFFHRREQAEADLLYLGPRAEQAVHTGALPPELAAAALDYWGQVLQQQEQRDAAQHAFSAAVRVDQASPGGQDASKRLHPGS